MRLARAVDDGGPGTWHPARSPLMDRSGASGRRTVVGAFFTHGHEAHGLRTNPEHTLLYVAHELPESPRTFAPRSRGRPRPTRGRSLAVRSAPVYVPSESLPVGSA